MNKSIIVNPTEIRTDELQRLVMEEVVRRRGAGNEVTALVLPAGSGEVPLALAKLDCRVTAGDTPKLQGTFQRRLEEAMEGGMIRYAPFNFAAIPPDLPGEPFDLIFLRRGLCSLPYQEARQLVRQLLLRLKIGGKLFLSTLGLHSELGDGYPGAECDLNQRYCQLAAPMAAKYDIHTPVCLYSERNLFTLMLEAGGSVLRTFTSTHGNVKGVAVRV